MARSATRTGGLRAITAVVALYALALQAFLGGLMPMPSMMATGGFDPLCLSAADPAAASGESGSPLPAHHGHESCCVAAAMAAPPAPPALLATSVAWPPRGAVLVTWPPEIRVAARAPPRSIAHPRGPPAV